MPSFALHVVTDKSTHCETFQLYRELAVYKDPSLFVEQVNLLSHDRDNGWRALMAENPLLTRISGTVKLMRLGPPRSFSNFGEISYLYELADKRFKIRRNQVLDSGVRIIPVRFCAEDEPYSDTLGFVLQSDLTLAQKRVDEGTRPPSVKPSSAEPLSVSE